MNLKWILKHSITWIYVYIWWMITRFYWNECKFHLNTWNLPHTWNREVYIIYLSEDKNFLVKLIFQWYKNRGRIFFFFLIFLKQKPKRKFINENILFSKVSPIHCFRFFRRHFDPNTCTIHWGVGGGGARVRFTWMKREWTCSSIRVSAILQQHWGCPTLIRFRVLQPYTRAL